MDELKEKIARALHASVVGDTFGRAESETLAQAALIAIEEAGYCAIKIETLEHVTELLVDTWSTAMRGNPEQEVAVIDARSAIDPVESRPTYAQLSDSATSFNPEKQFEKDNDASQKWGFRCDAHPDGRCEDPMCLRHDCKIEKELK